MNAVYTALDDLPCESHKKDYILKIPLSSEARFTTALIFFNQEVVFAWYNGQVFVDRIPNNFIVNFETELGAKYQNLADDENMQASEHYKVPVDQLQATIDLQSPYSNLSKQALWEIQEEIKRERIIELKKRALDEAMANIECLYPRNLAWFRTEAEKKHIDELRKQAFDEAMADPNDFYSQTTSRLRSEAEERRIDELKQQAFDRAMAEC